MHLWPSLRIRDSFKIGYLKKLEWNIKRMNSEKESQSNQKLLESQSDVDGKGESSSDHTNKIPGFFLFCREMLMLLSCCYCCFCCGACVEQEEY